VPVGHLLRRGDRLIRDRLRARRFGCRLLHGLGFGGRGRGFRHRDRLGRRRFVRSFGCGAGDFLRRRHFDVYFGFDFCDAVFFAASRRRHFFQVGFFPAGVEVWGLGQFNRRRGPFPFAVSLAGQGDAGEDAAEDEHRAQRQGEESPARRRTRS
jgi:hypothetical protein